MRHFIWISFDFGVSGDYQGMYAWLDRHSAKECGDSLAGVWYEHPGDLLEDLKGELADAVKIATRDRVYVIRHHDGKMKGTFLFGNRKSPPWSGYAPSAEPVEDVNE